MNRLRLINWLVLVSLTVLSCDHTAISPERIGQGFSFYVEVNADATREQTSVSLCLTEGTADTDYSVLMLIDGKEISTGKERINFRNSPIVTFTLDAVTPGKHTLKVILSNADKSVTVEQQFTEPLRHTAFDVYITTEGKKTYISFGENPYEVAVSLVDTLSVTGVCTYTVCTYEGYTRKESKTLTKTERGRMTRFIPEEGEKYELCDSENLEDLLGCMGVMNWGWGTQWDSSGEGSVIYYEEAKGMSYYQVTSRSISIKAEIEAFSGMTINVHNSYPSLWWNGTFLSRSTYSYKLQ